MYKEEKEYLLKIINIQDNMLTAYAQKDMNKFILLQKELERLQKESFNSVVDEYKNRKRESLKKVKNLFAEVECIVKDL